MQARSGEGRRKCSALLQIVILLVNEAKCVYDLVAMVSDVVS